MMNKVMTVDWKNIIKENDLIVWGQAQAEPISLTQDLMQKLSELPKFRVFLGISNYTTCQPVHAEKIDFSSYCGAGSNRNLAKNHHLDILPLHYSTLADNISPDILLIQVSAPNELGQYSFGHGQDYISDLIPKSKIIIAQINSDIPWTYSETYLKQADFDYFLESNYKHSAELNNEHSLVNLKIAENVASIIPNGSTLQIGIGTLPEAVLNALNQHKNLGIHSGIINDGVGELTKLGVINNAEKPIDTGITITGLINGSDALQQLVQLNAEIQLRPTSYTHSADVLTKIHNLIAVNSAIEVDLTGQVNAEVANGVYVGAIGGALDFIRAANQAKNGCSIIALPAAGKNFSRIVSRLNGPVSTPRCDIGIIVTEFGIADLRGLSIKQRLEKMIAIAAPEYRAQLRSDAQNTIYL
ncbi:acetyl-CoA hydrolase/transferase family protein [Acinetobacter sp. YH16057]|uniref:acetyl-CoA hydrolase/transferase family protein n=1 Tax=unclassified Acinetobacter TaxID=196816 RepID=UPI00359FAEF9